MRAIHAPGATLLAMVAACVLLPIACYAHGVMTVPASRALGTQYEDYQYCFGTPDCACGQFPDAGPIVATYHAGETIHVSIRITVSHETKPTFRFQLCPTGEQSVDCFVAGEFATAEFDSTTGTHDYQITIPQDADCDPCVLRWKWDYGFLSCADVRILADGTPVRPSGWSALKALYR